MMFLRKASEYTVLSPCHQLRLFKAYQKKNDANNQKEGLNFVNATRDRRFGGSLSSF